MFISDKRMFCVSFQANRCSELTWRIGSRCPFLSRLALRRELQITTIEELSARECTAQVSWFLQYTSRNSEVRHRIVPNFDALQPKSRGLFWDQDSDVQPFTLSQKVPPITSWFINPADYKLWSCLIMPANYTYMFMYVHSTYIYIYIDII